MIRIPRMSSAALKRLVIAAGVLVNAAFLAGLFILVQRTGVIQMDLSPGEDIRTLPYVTGAGTGRDEKVIISRYDAGRAQPGVNLFIAGHLSGAALVANDGAPVHEWWSGADPTFWHHVKLDTRGLWVIDRDKSLMLLDHQSREIEHHKLRFHHDLDVAPNGDVYALYRKSRRVRWDGRVYPALIDAVAVIREGEIIKHIDLFPILRPFIDGSTFEAIDAELEAMAARGESLQGTVLRNDTPFDLFHANSIDVLEASIPGFCEKGDLLLSIRHLNMIVVIDAGRNKARWVWGPGVVHAQHHATLLPSGTVLLFDNGTPRRGSRVLEIDPVKKTIVWSYPKERDPRFFSDRRGGVQRLSNGNTLITVSDDARVVEVTPDGDIVWEFVHPDYNEKLGTRPGPYRLERYDDPARFPDGVVWKRK